MFQLRYWTCLSDRFCSVSFPSGVVVVGFSILLFNERRKKPVHDRPYPKKSIHSVDNWTY